MEMSTFLSIFGNIQSKTKFALSVTTGPALRTAMRRLHVPPRASSSSLKNYLVNPKMYLKNYSSDYGNQQNFHRLHQLHQCTGPKQDIIQDLQAEDHFEGSATYGSSPSDEIILPTVPNEILYPPAHSSMINRKWKIIYYSSAWMKISYRGRHTVV
ncbi:hypothetical protein T08_3719 [Trichinella sp. T8]|nr:hypothetical protein T08_3719 [Trichinella sp. T8]